MTVTTLLASLGRRLQQAIPWGGRGAWCRRQRRELRLRGAVVWVRGNAVPWAEWGATRGYFEVRYMDGLAYLQAVDAPVP